MEIVINGETKQVPGPMTLAGLVVYLEMNPKFIAIERNRELIPRAEHATCQLQEKDQLEIVTLVGGG